MWVLFSNEKTFKYFNRGRDKLKSRIFNSINQSNEYYFAAAWLKRNSFRKNQQKSATMLLEHLNIIVGFLREINMA